MKLPSIYTQPLTSLIEILRVCLYACERREEIVLAIASDIHHYAEAIPLAEIIRISVAK